MYYIGPPVLGGSQGPADAYSQLLLMHPDEASEAENNAKIAATDKSVEEYLKKVSDLEEAENESISIISKEVPIASVPAAVPPPTGPTCASVSHAQEPPEVKSRFISFPDMKPEKLLKGAALKQIETLYKPSITIWPKATLVRTSLARQCTQSCSW